MSNIQIKWETLTTDIAVTIQRAQVPGGWLVISVDEVITPNTLNDTGYEWRSSICFMPDPNHEWLKPPVVGVDYCEGCQCKTCKYNVPRGSSDCHNCSICLEGDMKRLSWICQDWKKEE